MASPQAVLLLCFFSFNYAAVFDDDSDSDYDTTNWDNFSDNLNQNINQQVRANLQGLDGLGARISQQVQQGLRPVHNLNNLGASISQQVQQGLRPLNNLGNTISQQVHQGLRPVREMQFRLRIRFGQGGTTIASFKDKRFIIQNGVMYECSGTISETDGSCSGTLSKTTFKKKEDFCFANVNSIINNWYCIGTGSVNSGMVNGNVYCSSPDNSPTLLISAEEYKTLCGSKTSPVSYKYFTREPLGEYGPDVQCSGSPLHVCTMTEYNHLNVGNVVNSGTSYIHISG